MVSKKINSIRKSKVRKKKGRGKKESREIEKETQEWIHEGRGRGRSMFCGFEGVCKKTLTFDSLKLRQERLGASRRWRRKRRRK